MERLTERTAIGVLVKEDYGEKALKTLYSCNGGTPDQHYTNCDEGYCAMEKLAAYEDVGAVSTCRNAVEICRAMIERGIEMDNIKEYIIFEDNLVQRGYDLKRLLEMMEQQTAKKAITYRDTNRADCPACGATVRGIGAPFGNWCSKCGQKLDWSDVE